MIREQPSTVLIIEDDADTRANLCDILELDGHQVAMAATVAEAVARSDWQEIFAIILDRQLPDGNAEELLPRLKQLAPHASVLIVTGHADLQNVIAAMRSGAADYILKPVNPDNLRLSLVRARQQQQLAEEKRKAEERALQAERLAAIGQTVTGLAHESRNAFQRSQACLELLALELDGKPEQLELVQRIQRALDHLHRLYEEVRDYAAPIRLERQSCDLAHLWRDAWSHLELARKDKPIQLIEKIASSDLSLSVDWFGMGQVFRNILENAISATPSGGEIVITTLPAKFEGKPALEISIRDTGPGLAPDSRERVFDAFFTTKAKGTGLGMAIAKRIVEAHGGKIVVGDSPGGAEFIITLPRNGLSNRT
jgi:signal transduction histidine kinase